MLQSYNILFEFMEILGKKWIVPLLLFLLFYERTNFSQMKKHLRLTSRALSRKLKLLETLGLVERVVLENPKKVYYALSEKGKRISGLLVGFGSKISQ